MGTRAPVRRDDATLRAEVVLLIAASRGADAGIFFFLAIRKIADVVFIQPVCFGDVVDIQESVCVQGDSILLSFWEAAIMNKQSQTQQQQQTNKQTNK